METIMKNDLAIDHAQHNKYLEGCSSCFAENLVAKPSCEYCQDTGFITKTEWAEPNESYDVIIRCVCQED